MGAGDIQADACGRRIRLVHNDPNIENVLAAGFDRLTIERSIDGGLTYSELTSPSSRPVLDATTPDYIYFDHFGDATYYYRTRYIDSRDGTLSDPSDAIEGAGLAIQSLLTVPQLKQRYLFGLDLTDDDGNEIPDSVYEHYILSAIAWFEHELDMPVLPTSFEEEMSDYYRTDYGAFNIIQLENYPVISVSEFSVDYPSGQNVIIFPQEWIRLDKHHGIVRIVPTAGALSEILIGQGGSYLPAIYNGLDHLPDLFSLTYTAGFEDGRVPRNIVDVIGKVASMGPFNIFGDLIIGAGIATVSTSIDGLSQNIGSTASATNSGYGSRIIQYGKEVKDWMPKLRRYYKGIRMIVA